MKVKNVISLFFIGFISFSAFSQDYYLQCGSILDTQTGQSTKNATIIVKNNKISTIK